MNETTLTLKPPAWLPISVAVILGVFYVLGQTMAVKEEKKKEAPATISVQGKGKIYIVPDIALLNFGVSTGRQKTAEKAMTVLSEKMNAVVDAIKAQGIEEKDIRTQSLYLNPAYDWQDGRRVDRGFEATQNLQVKVRDLDKLSDVIAVTTSAGVNQVGNVQFTVDDMEAARAEAREEAIKDAKAKAKKLAGDLNVSLGRILSFTEGGGGYPSPITRGMAVMEMAVGIDGAKGPPIPAGEQEINVTVTLGYEIE